MGREMEDSDQVNARLLDGENEGVGLCKRVWIESKKLWIVACPAMFTRFSQFGLFILSLVFIGHIGNTELAALSLVFQVLARFSIGLLMGMSSGLETLCGQAFGANQYHMLGIYLQRAWIIELIFSLPLVIMFIFAGPVLRLLGQTEEIAVVANKFSLWYIPIIISYIFYSTLQMYLQAQSKNMIITWVAVPCLLLHGFGSWLLEQKLGLGVNVVMLSMNIVSWLPIMAQLIFVFCGGCPDTWAGFSMLAFVDLWPVLKLCVSSGVMLSLELWYTAILILLTGKTKDSKIAIDAISICLNVSGFGLMISFAFLAAASVRVANELGRGSTSAAKFAIVVVLSTSLAIGAFLSAMILGFRHKFSYVFSSSAEVSDAVSDLANLLALSILINSVQPILSGVAVGAGWQSIVAYVNIICYYVVGLPLGIVLGYVVHLGVKGIWMGMTVGTAVQTLVLVGFTCKTDWEKQVYMAKKRLDRWFVSLELDGNGNA